MVRITATGKRDKLVVFQRATGAQDAYGEPILTWAEIGRAFALVMHGRGSERRQAAMEQGDQPATFRVLSSALTRGLTLRDRIVFEGRPWDIRGVVADSPARGEVEITAVSSPELAA
jgi:head-tail adaptor